MLTKVEAKMALSRRDVLSTVAATAVCSFATEGIAASPANGDKCDASTAGMSPAQLQAAQNAANSVPGPRFVPGRSIPVPSTASPEFQQTIAAPYRIPAWDADLKTSAEWKALVDRLADETVVQTRKVRDRLGVTLESTVIDGVKAFVLTPKTIAASNKNRLLVHIHGGGYVYNPGEAGTLEATLMAGYGGFKVISVDYRMPPDYPFPAGLDDAMRVWRAALKMHDPRNMAIFGSSAGAGMILAMMLRAKAEGLSLPAALGTGTPWANLTESGDTSKTNEWLDNVLVSYSGYLGRAARLYANGRPLTDPLISPIFGDFRNFPPTILTSGTRDLILSLTVLTHRKLRQADVEVYLQVFEGMSHFQFILDTESPESKEAFTEIARFFDRHLGT
jgi:acetyl esterase/lipase